MTAADPPRFDAALTVSASYEIRLDRYVHAVLSIPCIDAATDFRAKDLVTAAEPSTEGRYTVEEHLRFVGNLGQVRPDAPLLVLGMRNSLVNLRAPVIWRGRAYSVVGERPADSMRPYYGIGLRNGSLVIDRALGGFGDADAWPEYFCAGIPVLWDDMPEAELFDLMLCEAADHSHIYDLPRGHHHFATEATRAAWSQLHRVFTDHVHSGLEGAAAAMRAAISACAPPLKRCGNYFHAVIGINASGGLVCMFAHARLEDIGQRLRTLGCTRAVCVENSGSVTPTWFPSGLQEPAVPLVRVPNFRERGRAVLVIELANQRFDSQPASCLTTGCEGQGTG